MNNAELETMDQKQRSKNKARLLAQNKKLNTQIRNLQKEISQIVTARQNDLIRNFEQTSGELGKLREEIAVQQKYMKKLKGQIDFLKSANTKGNAQFIIKEEDELLLLKKQYENLIIEKGVVNKFKDDKLKILVKDKPFQDHKKSIEENLAAVKKSNKIMQAEITSLEREVRKFHNYIVLNNTLSRDKKQSSQLQYQIAKADHEIKQIQLKTKEIEVKWKSQLDGLDNQLFELKSNFNKTEAKLNQVQKEHRMWETRKNSLRYEEQILQFRDRLSKIQLLPQQKLLENAIKSQRKKQKLTASEIIKLRKSKILNEKQISQIVKQKKIENDIPAVKIIEQTQSQSGKTKNINQLNKKNNSLVRKSDKNITSAPQQLKKQKQAKEKEKDKDKQKDKEKEKLKQKQKQKELDKKNKNNKVLDQKQAKIKPKESLVDKSKSKQKIVEQQASQQKQIGKLKKSDSISKNKIEATVIDKNSPKNNEKKNSQKVEDNKKQNAKNGQELGKKKSQAKLDKSKEKEKQFSPKKQDKQRAKDEKVQAQLKPQNKKNELNKKSKQSQSPKAVKNEQKKPTKLILKSIGVGTG